MTALRLSLAIVAALLATILDTAASAPRPWSAADLRTVRSLWIGDLEPLPPDPGNRVADDPRAAALGERLFADARFSANGQVACSQCHRADRQFQDDLPLGRGVGTTTKRTMPLAGAARSPFLFWDGRKDSLWAQALGPLESAVEHGGTRAQYAHVVASHYRADYEDVFGALPDLSTVPRSAGPVGDPAAIAAWDGLSGTLRDAVTAIFVNVGKAIGAYERRLDVGPSRFDTYVAALVAGRPADGVLSADEVTGLRLFIGKAQCTRCHNGPLFTNHDFHNTGVPARPGLPADGGRAAGAIAVLADEFSCRSRWSDAGGRCPELDYLTTGDRSQERAYKVPSLRGVAARAPYMHAGQLATLADVLDHYNRAPAAPRGHSELEPLRLRRVELRQLEAFLRTLDVAPGGPTAGDERPPR
ncbi:MAG: cytochrome-c peroxidase [Vicinamibacterales bacterium]